MKNKTILFMFFFFSILFLQSSLPALTIGADDLNIENISDTTINNIKNKYIVFGHQSVGANILNGINALGGRYTGIIDYDFYAGSNYNPQSKINDFDAELTTIINGGTTIHCAFLKFCWVDIDSGTDVNSLFNSYRNKISQLKTRYPNIVFIHFTNTLDTSTGLANVKRNQYNSLLRTNYTGANDFVFDLAEIESTHQNGTRETFQYSGTTYYRLCAEYTDDGGHLYGIGRERAARGLISTLAAAMPAQEPPQGVSLELYGTFNSMGVIVHLGNNDPDRDATASVEYRTDNEPYKTGFPLSRVYRDLDNSELFVGSLFWLTAGTDYDVRVTIHEPDGGALDGFVLEGSGQTRTEITIPPALRSFYVSPNGNDSNNGSINTPFATIRRALQSAQPGDEIILRSGTYYEGGSANEGGMRVPVSGTEARPIVIKSFPGETAILDGSYPDNVVFNWSNAGNGVYTTDINLPLSNEVPNLISADGSRLLPYTSLADLQNLRWGVSGFYAAANGTTGTIYIHFTDNSSPAGKNIKISRYNEAFLVNRNYIYFVDLTFRYYGYGLYAQPIMIQGGSNNLVQGCTFAINDVSIGFKDNSGNNTIQNNEIYDTIFEWQWDAFYAGIELGIGIYTYGPCDNRGNTFRRNTIHDLFDGICTSPGNEAGLTNEIDVYENLIYRCGDDGIEADGRSSNVRIWGNIFHDLLDGISVAPILTGPCYAMYNLIYRTGAGNHPAEYSGSAFKFNSGSITTGQIYLFHNTSYADLPGNYGIEIKPEEVWPLLYSRNNIWIGSYNPLAPDDNIGYGFQYWPNNAGYQNIDFDYDNIWTEGTNGLVRWNYTIYTTIQAFTGAAGHETNGLGINPQFVDAPNGNFNLGAASLLIDSGVVITGINDIGPYIYRGTAPDIGVYENDGGSPPQNRDPVANAGIDQTITDTDEDGVENAALNGSGSSDSDGSIQSYIWIENGNQIADSVNPTVSLPVGSHTITLTVTDDDGATGTDSTVITVRTNTPPGQERTETWGDGLSRQNSNCTYTNVSTGTTLPSEYRDLIWVRNNGIFHIGKIIFDLNNLAGKSIINAKIYLSIGYDKFSAGIARINLYPVTNDTGAGNPDAITYIQNPSAVLEIPADKNGDNYQINPLDVTNIIKYWIENGNTNKGFVLIPDSGVSIALASDEHAGLERRPYLEITYSEPGQINDPPTADAQSVTTNEDIPKSITLSGTDPDGDSLTYMITAQPSHGTLSGTAPNINYIPAANYNGADLFTFKVNDGTVDSANAGVSITVTSLNDAPVLAPIGNKSVNENSALSFTITASDIDGNSLTYTAVNLPQGAVFNAGTRTFSWTPAFNQTGSYNVTFTVIDNGTPNLSDSEIITISVGDVNRPPELAPIGNKTVNEGQQLNFTITASDSDGNQLTYSASNLPSGANFYPATRTFTWTPVYTQSGTYNVTFAVTDNGSPILSDSKTITITVNNINRAPVLAVIGNKSVNEGQELSFTVSAADPDGGQLTYTAANLPAGAAFNTGTRTFSWIPNYNQSGTYNNITFAASDGSLSDTETITIIVNNVVVDNQPPVITINRPANGTITNESLIIIEGSVNEPSRVLINGSQIGANINGNFSAQINLSNGENTITIQATDQSNNTGNVSITVTYIPQQEITPPENFALDCRVTASSYYNETYKPECTIDGKFGIWDQYEWASSGEMNPWIKFNWDTPILANKAVFYDRSNPIDHIVDGYLYLNKDGQRIKAIHLGMFPYGGSAKEVVFDETEFDEAVLAVTNGIGMNIGLSEFQIFHDTDIQNTNNLAIDSTVSTSSSYNANYGAECAKDGKFGIWDQFEWASKGEMNPWIKFKWNTPILANKAVFYDRSNPIDHIVDGYLYLNKNGQRIKDIHLGMFPYGGSAKEVVFDETEFDEAVLAVTNGIGMNIGLSEFQIFYDPDIQNTSNLALDCTVSTSSTYNGGYRSEFAIDGKFGIWDQFEWASSGEMNPSIRFKWSIPILANKAVFYDRSNPIDHIRDGYLYLNKNGQRIKTIHLGMFPYGGSAKKVVFDTLEFDEAFLVVTDGIGLNIGLSEFQIFNEE